MRQAALAPALALVLLAGCVSPLLQGAGTTGEASPFTTTRTFDVAPWTTEGEATLPLPGPYRARPLEVTTLRAADGVALQLGLVLPDARERVPTILVASPYYGADGITARELLTANSGRFADLVTHGYAVALLSVRGTAMSGGCLDWWGPVERADLVAAVEDLTARPWSDGTIGMIGFSYDGGAALEVASAGIPQLKTVVAIAPVTDIYDIAVVNGTMPATLVPFVGAFRAATGGARACPESETAMQRAFAHAYATRLRDPDGYAAARAMAKGAVGNYTGSLLLAYGFRDPLIRSNSQWPFVDDLAARGDRVKLLLGPWEHQLPGRAATFAGRADWQSLLVAWFDRELRGDPLVDVGPRVQVADQTGRWRNEERFPPTDAVERTFYLTPGGLRDEPGAGSAVLLVDPFTAAVDGSVNPLAAQAPEGARSATAACPTCARFATPALDEELRFSGFPRLPLLVTPTGPGGQLVADLLVVADGKEQLVGSAVMDLRFAAADGASRPVVPGATILAKMQFGALDVVVPQGGRLVLSIAQGGEGTSGRGVGSFATFLYRGNDQPPAPIRLELGERSALVLDVFERDEDAFFEARPR